MIYIRLDTKPSSMTLFKGADAVESQAVQELFCDNIMVNHEIDVIVAQIDLIIS